ncbi:hypothetical protein O181_000755 [Austropuccinia psidii MF-1]|uniref:Lysophospholipase NTE1 n=1 Tax=Austropuccinia psidii MF-1 TaxID=1389203 RepID=A0A9Q3B9M5_9BASI|nr:hypothetical protein [Austropuccinia psidii MF-1]
MAWSSLNELPIPIYLIYLTFHYLWFSLNVIGFWFYSALLSTLSFLTITLPKTLFAILHWSGFISVQLNFQKLLILFVLFAIISSWTYKLKVLNKYSFLPKPSQLTKSLDNQIAFRDLNPTLLLNSNQILNDHQLHFDNYLNEFLSAIRVFGFLEKPVFHELARHLQTHKLLAGDTLNLDQDKSFYIVVDGSVQVFAGSTNHNLTSSSQSDFQNNDHLAYDNEDDNGFQLLNVVGPGGTLSSLFTILNLLTEDVKLRHETDELSSSVSPKDFNLHKLNQSTDSTNSSSPAKLNPHLTIPSKSTQSSTLSNNPSFQTLKSQIGNEKIQDRSPFNLQNDHNLQDQDDPKLHDPRSTYNNIQQGSYSPHVNSNTPKSPIEPPQDNFKFHSSLNSIISNQESHQNFQQSTTRTNSFIPSAEYFASSRLNSNLSSQNHPSHSRQSQARSIDENQFKSQTTQRTETHPKESTIARATRDTTLAVIPSQAFKRLTFKFPNAVARIVQVILTRLQRVTFLTSHKYLGLTKELLRIEKAFNELACFPLPTQFYEDGGMIRLRQRFMSSTALIDESHSKNGLHHASDYFNFNDPRSSNNGFNSIITKPDQSLNLNQRRPSISKSQRTLNPDATSESNVKLKSRYRDRQSTSSYDDLSSPFRLPKLSTNDLHEDLELKELVMKSISKSIGLIQQSPTSLSSKSPEFHLDSINQPYSSSSKPFSNISRSEFSPDPSLYSNGFKSFRSIARPNFRSGLGSLSYLRALSGSNKGFRDESLETSSSMESSSIIHDTEDDDEEKGEAPNEVEILYFPKDSTLVKAGERNAGLYFVIDGFLDVFMPSDEPKEPKNYHHHEDDEDEDEDDFQTQYWSKKSSFSSSLPYRGSNKKMEDYDKHIRSSKIKGLTKITPKPNPRLETFEDISRNSKNLYKSNRNSSNSTSTSRNYSKRSHPTNIKTNQNQEKTNSFRPKKEGKSSKQKSWIKLFSIKPGGITGYLSAISGFPSYIEIRAKTDAYVGFLSSRSLESIMDRQPIVLLTLAKRLISLLSPLMLHIDSALEWMAVDAGQIIYREGDSSDNLYMVIGGRLRAISEKDDGGLEILAEYGQGESIGELDCITNTSRRSTLHAIRDSELVRIPMTLFNAISVRHPSITVQISRLIATRVRKEVDSNQSITNQKRSHGIDYGMGKNRHSMTSFRPDKHGSNSICDLGINNFNLKTVAIIPNAQDVPILEFAARLNEALEQMNATTKMLNQEAILSVLGRHAFSRFGKLKLAEWLTELEQKFRIVLYVADTGVNTPWTRTCIRQADYIMVVCDGGVQPDIGQYERLLVSMKTTARKELVLLHPDRNVPAGSTRPWLMNRPWVHAHHHVEMAGATPLTKNHLDELVPLTALRRLTQKVQRQLLKYRRDQLESRFSRVTGLANNDFSRLARRLCGKSIGLVLGGGGARGISHIGVIRALEERNIPIDMIGGTSIGSFIGGLYARNSDFFSTLGRAKTFSARIATYWRLLTDLTYPVVAYTTGHEFNRGIYKSFYDYHIEDFWLPFWANTTNITWSRMEVHSTGYAWRYIRASMSLAGLLPPLCDEGDMLVDGGYIDNLPVSVMLRLGAESIFAVDVGSIDDTSPRNFPESLSGWWLLFSRLNPWSSAHKIPTMTDIQSRLTYVSSVKTLEEAKVTPGVLYMRMPVTEFTTLGFGRFEEIFSKGYESAKELIKEFEVEGKLPTGLIEESDSEDSRLKIKFGLPNHQQQNKNMSNHTTSASLSHRYRLMTRRNSV